jgi:hypothetical protein
MKIRYIFLSAVVLFHVVHAQASEEGEATAGTSFWSSFRLTPQIETRFPTFLGAGGALHFQDRIKLDLQYGLVPTPYYRVIANQAARSSGNSSYKDVIEAAFQNNAVLRFGATYFFGQNEAGWRFGVAYSMLSSSGKAGIDQVLKAATGSDYTQLKNLLTAAGRSTLVDMNSLLGIAEAEVGYAWNVRKNITLVASLGVAKVTSADVLLKTGLPNFEASNAGNSLLRSTESEIESITLKYGVSPTLGLGAQYNF